MKGTYLAASATSAADSIGVPSRIPQVSGLWQYWQRSGQPWVNTTNRVPGPSTPVDRSQEWIEPGTEATRAPAAAAPVAVTAAAGPRAAPMPLKASRGRYG